MRKAPEYFALNPGAHCDLIVVAGAHNYVGPLLDAINLMRAGACGTRIVMDDVCDSDACHAYGPDGRRAVAQLGKTLAWAELKRAGYAREVEVHFEEAADRGWVQGTQSCLPEGLPAVGNVSASTSGPSRVAFVALPVQINSERGVGNQPDARVDSPHRQEASLRPTKGQRVCTQPCAEVYGREVDKAPRHI